MSDAASTPAPWQKTLVLVAAGLLALCIGTFALIAIVQLASETFYDSDAVLKAWGSAAIGGFYAVLILGAAVVIHKGRFFVAMFVAIGFSVISALLTMLVVWIDVDGGMNERIGLIVMTCTFLGIAILHTGAMACLPTRSSLLSTLKVAVCAGFSGPVVIGTVMIWWSVLINKPDWFEIVVPLLVLVAFLSLIGTSAVAALIRRDNRQWEKARESVSQRIELRLECPRCNEPQSVRAGPAKCRACGLMMEIELEEPRCECGYLLYRLHSPTCPECGEIVPEESRWRSEAAANA